MAEQTTTGQTTTEITGERADLLATLATARHFLRFTTRDLTDEQAGLRTTASELCLGGLIKHVTAVETPSLKSASAESVTRTACRGSIHSRR